MDTGASIVNGDAAKPDRELLYFKILGRTLEHFGVQMYKRREVAIAELVANCWDAGATEVFVDVPLPNAYDRDTSTITVRDTGCGMTFEDVKTSYLVLGRNRRREGGAEIDTCLAASDGDAVEAENSKLPKRRVMGRKGIGKLAGFGLAQEMTVTTWKDGEGIEFHLSLTTLKTGDNESKDVPIEWKEVPPRTDFSPSGTIVTLQVLKHKTPIDVEGLRRSLSRRFSRLVKGEMTIKVNGSPLPDPTPPLDFRVPPTDSGKEFEEETLSDGSTVKYWYGFAKDVIHEKELRGFSVLVSGKVAQAPPFFFEVEAKASGQHSTKYVIGEIEADFIDIGLDDEGDLVSTDRQEIDWEAEEVQPLKKWGEALTRKVLRDCRDFRGRKTVEEVMLDPELERRINRLDKPSQKEITKFLTILADRDTDTGGTLELADALIRAYEFRQFHDVVEELEKASEDPNQLANMLRQMNEWKVLESRAILEIIKGRLDILDKFEKMLCNDAPETASSRSPENMHDLLAGNPWLLNPEWQVLSEEKTITRQLQEWGAKDFGEDYKGRYDFLALSDAGILVVIEIKRPEYAAELVELHRLQEYANKLALPQERPIRMLFIHGRDVKVSPAVLSTFEQNPNFEMREWNRLFERTRRTYEHYRAVLEGSVEDPNFAIKEEEVRRTRHLLEQGMHRSREERANGIPSQDVDYSKQDKG